MPTEGMVQPADPALGLVPGAEIVNPGGRLRRGLTARHLQFIAIGGAIGSGLFLGSAAGIRNAGPALLVAYAVGGLMIFFIARALGEMALAHTQATTLDALAEDYIHPAFGFLVGWNYWMSWILVGMVDITAMAIFFKFWFPEVPQWIPALVSLMTLYGINLCGVRLFGELEFWLTLGKVITIVGMMLAGIFLLVKGIGLTGAHASLANIWNDGGMFPTGLGGFLAALPVAFFAFGGSELVGLAAGEAENPERSLPRAINGVVARILIFYIGSLAIIMALVPWRQITLTESPFVLVFTRIGLPATASLINLVLITAVLSSCNSGLFAGARTLQSLGNQAPCARLACPHRRPRRADHGHQRFGGDHAWRRVLELLCPRQSDGIHHLRFGHPADGHLDQHHRQPYRLSQPGAEGCRSQISHAALSLGKLDRPGLHRQHRGDHGDLPADVYPDGICIRILCHSGRDLSRRRRESPRAGIMIGEPPDFIRALDAADPVRAFRQRFSLPPGIVYLDGNSLGALPAATATRLDEVVRQEWGNGLIRSWNTHDWVGASRRVGDKIAALIGAREGEVVVADSTSVNIFKLLMAGIGARPGRKIILSEAGNFPTDLYVAQGISALLPQLSVRAVEPGQVLDAISNDVAVLLLTHVHYKTGHKYDMAAITRRAHECGALVIWDLCHSAGAVEVDLGAVDADMAVGCGYKYLNGGPGAPSFLYVAKRLQRELTSPITGWFGHAAPFAFAGDYQPAPDIARFLSGTPPILGLTALEIGNRFVGGSAARLAVRESHSSFVRSLSS